MARVEANVSRTWDVPESVAAAIHDAARRLNCYDSAVVSQLLGYALQELSAGRLMPKRRPMLYELTGLERRSENGPLKLDTHE